MTLAETKTEQLRSSSLERVGVDDDRRTMALTYYEGRYVLEYEYSFVLRSK